MSIFKLNKIFYRGKLEGEFIIPFLPNGKIGKEYNFSGIVKQATINLTNEFSIKNLTTIIDHSIIQGSSNFKAVIKKGEMFDLDLTNTEINLKRRNNSTNIESVTISGSRGVSADARGILGQLEPGTRCTGPGTGRRSLGSRRLRVPEPGEDPQTGRYLLRVDD